MLVGASVLAAVVVVSVSVLAGNAGAQSTSSSKPNGLELAKPTDDKVVGSLARSGIPTVKFQSEETVSRGEASSDSGKSAEGDKFAVTSVDAGSLSLDARRDLQTDTVTLDGHSERITTSQKDALLALCEGLESSLGPTGAELSPSEVFWSAPCAITRMPRWDTSSPTPRRRNRHVKSFFKIQSQVWIRNS